MQNAPIEAEPTVSELFTEFLSTRQQLKNCRADLIRFAHMIAKDVPALASCGNIVQSVELASMDPRLADVISHPMHVLYRNARHLVGEAENEETRIYNLLTEAQPRDFRDIVLKIRAQPMFLSWDTRGDTDDRVDVAKMIEHDFLQVERRPTTPFDAKIEAYKNPDFEWSDSEIGVAVEVAHQYLMDWNSRKEHPDSKTEDAIIAAMCEEFFNLVEAIVAAPVTGISGAAHLSRLIILLTDFDMDRADLRKAVMLSIANAAGASSSDARSDRKATRKRRTPASEFKQAA
jgi:hypothetical protein